MSLLFLVPFSIPYLIKIMHFDNYDIKHNTWFSYIILFLMFFPIIIVLLTYTSFNNKLSIFPNIYKYIEQNDYSFFNFVENNFNFKIYSILPYLLIIFCYCYYEFIYTGYKYVFKKSLIVYAILFFIIFIFIPFIIFFFSLSLIFDNKDSNNGTNEDEIIENIKKNGVSSLYDILVKYNYPCFIK